MGYRAIVEVLFILIPLSIVLGAIGLSAFFWTMLNGQYDDLEGAAERVLLDEGDYTGTSISQQSTGACEMTKPAVETHPERQ